MTLTPDPALTGIEFTPYDRHELRAMFAPRAVAVIGVSRGRAGLGRRVYQALQTAGFPGPIYPITRDGSPIDGKQTWTTVRGLAEVDLAVIAVPADAVEGAVDDCIAAGVKAIVLITAGFAEVSEEGRARQRRLVEKVRAAGVRMVGPNCMGLMSADPERPLNASFSPVFPPPGGLALLSQSGALGIVVLDLASRRGVGLSSFVSVGNKADVSGNDLLEYWAVDPATRTIAFYLESFGNPRRFAQIARRVARTKPIIAVKAGRTRAGRAAAGSHTAALAASDVAVAALFQQTGVIRADTIDEMFDLAACLEAQPLPAGHRVAIVTNAGGPGILAADACEASGLEVVQYATATRDRLAAALPGAPAVGNPLDMIATAGPEEYRRAIEVLLAADEVDSLLILFTPVDAATSAPILEAIRAGVRAGRQTQSRSKPILACLMADDVHHHLEVDGERIPVYPFPENAARALGKVSAYAKWRSAPVGLPPSLEDVQPGLARAVCAGALAARGDDWLTPEESSRLLACYGLCPTPAIPVRTRDEAVATATAMGFPVVAKISSPDALHKSDIGGVITNLRNADEVGDAFDRMQARALEHHVRLDAVLIQSMVSDGIETVIGVYHDRLFGSLVGFGTGGVDVEIQGDMRFRVTPVTDRDIEELLHEPRVARRFAGFRGRPPADIAALRDVLGRVARLAEDLPEIAEMDMNPVLVRPAGCGCQIVDVRIRVQAPATRAMARTGAAFGSERTA